MMFVSHFFNVSSPRMWQKNVLAKQTTRCPGFLVHFLWLCFGAGTVPLSAVSPSYEGNVCDANKQIDIGYILGISWYTLER